MLTLPQLTRVLRHINQLVGDSGGVKGGLHHIAGVADEGVDSAVSGVAGVHVQQRGSGSLSDSGSYRLDHLPEKIREEVGKERRGGRLGLRVRGLGSWLLDEFL